MSVVYGTDFSDLAAAGARGAAALSRLLGLGLHLVHALEPAADERRGKDREASAREHLASAAEDLRERQPGLSVQESLVHGPAY